MIDKILEGPVKLLLALGARNKFPLSDKSYLKMRFKSKTGCKLSLKEPKTFNEKIQWLKLYDRRPEYIDMVDKYTVKQYVEKKIGKKYIIPTLGLWDKFEDIDFEVLPEQFVLKCTHDSGGIVICRDKRFWNKSEAEKILTKSLKRNYYWLGREWPYKKIKPRIIAERYMTDESGKELKDYKIFTFHGVPRLIQVDFNRFIDHRRNMYTTDWEYIDMSIEFPTDSSCHIRRPKKLEEMLELAAILSKGIPHVRVDFYSVDDHIYFGELTFYHGSGFERFTPEDWNYKLGEWIKLSKKD